MRFPKLNWLKLKLPTSIRWRMTLANLLLLSVFIVITATGLESAFTQQAESTRQERLQAVSYLLMADTEVDSEGKIHLPSQLTESNLMSPASGLYAQILSTNSIWQSPSSAGQPVAFVSSLPKGQRYFTAVEEAGHRYFSFALGVIWPTDKGPVPLTFSISEDAKPFDLQMQQFRKTLWRWLAACAALLLILQILFLRFGLSPLKKLAAGLTAIEKGNSEKLEGQYPREIQPLTDNLNALIESERARQQRYERALGDLAHSLKTPIAVIRSTPPQSDTFVPTVQEQTSRIESLIGYQLQRAATRGANTFSKQTPLSPIVQRLVLTLTKIHRDKQIKFRNDIPPALLTRLSEGDAMELFGNLLDNAGKWANSQVRISAVLQRKRYLIAVEDDGPGVSNPDAALKRGIRLDEHVPGHGIGLSIVEDIVSNYNGDIRIERSSTLGGAAFIVSFPI